MCAKLCVFFACVCECGRGVCVCVVFFFVAVCVLCVRVCTHAHLAVVIQAVPDEYMMNVQCCAIDRASCVM